MSYWIGVDHSPRRRGNGDEIAVASAAHRRLTMINAAAEPGTHRPT
jgi:hypothetical protein